ncbi:unnamed protein product [Pleuronectes platessa]|uniref:Uncharacterized protein n=1 Tax=Pleuronectes platessa TaxID=8262 RepID=A0A9N7Y7X5_PLEPL|nr:unnamed protein product [Pleuronectes platessa]
MPGWKKNIPACLQPDQEGVKTWTPPPAGSSFVLMTTVSRPRHVFSPGDSRRDGHLSPLRPQGQSVFRPCPLHEHKHLHPNRRCRSVRRR